MRNQELVEATGPVSCDEIQLIADLFNPATSGTNKLDEHKSCFHTESQFNFNCDEADFSNFLIKTEVKRENQMLTGCASPCEDHEHEGCDHHHHHHHDHHHSNCHHEHEHFIPGSDFHPVEYDMDMNSLHRCRHSMASTSSAQSFDTLRDIFIKPPHNLFESSCPSRMLDWEHADLNQDTQGYGDERRRKISENFLNLVNPARVHVEDQKDIAVPEVKTNAKDVKMYRCGFPGCRREFTWLWALKEHERRHQQSSKKRNFKCEECGKAFFTKSCLKSHMKIHTRKPNSYKCKYEGCNKTYSTAEGLRLHIRNHHQVDKRWVCPAPGCGKAFVRQSDMRLHIMRIHAKTRPHPCRFDGCNKTFACLSELRRHEMSHVRKQKKNAQLLKNKRAKLVKKESCH